ncbi:MAG: hypothetical protein WBP29_09190 [Candidatus Zixiibacteriota bacterium]
MKRYSSIRLIILSIIAMFIFSAIALPATASAGKYPKNGVFKRLPDSKDYWYYIDNNNWEIKAPDKWTHMMGSMGSTSVLSRFMNKYAAGALVLAFGLYKEYDDAYREGWSYRDIIADAVGITASLTANDRYRLLCDYDSEKVMLVMSVTVH